MPIIARTRNKTAQYCLFILTVMTPALAQLNVGAKIGVPATAYFDTGRTDTQDYSAATRRYTIGVSAEYWTSQRTGIAVDALYKRMGYVAILTGTGERFAIDVKGNSWDFPMRLKYSVCTPFYIDAGGALRYIGPVRGRGVLGSTPVDTTSPVELTRRLYAGVTMAAGVTFGGRRSRWVIECRYTRWLSNLKNTPPELRLAPNQVEVVVGWLALVR